MDLPCLLNHSSISRQQSRNYCHLSLQCQIINLWISHHQEDKFARNTHDLLYPLFVWKLYYLAINLRIPGNSNFCLAEVNLNIWWCRYLISGYFEINYLI